MGLTETGLAIYGLLTTEPSQGGVVETQLPYGQLDESKKALAEVIEEAARPHVRMELVGRGGRSSFDRRGGFGLAIHRKIL